MDITNFMTWFIAQVISMFTWVYTTLDSITFAGTSLLKVTVTITILVPLMGVLLTISRNDFNLLGSRSERVKDKKGESKNES